MSILAETAGKIFLEQYPDSTYVDNFSTLFEFLYRYPGKAQYLHGKQIFDNSYIKAMATRFVKGRHELPPSMPRTISDPMINVILSKFYKVSEDDIPRALIFHNYSMSAENIIGNLLEHYIASEAEKVGWVWCSGQFIKAIDFIKKTSASNKPWEMLQIKNRDNSENSSSSAIRTGTNIKKWFRTFSHTGRTNWPNFPDNELRTKLSEEKFRNFIENYLDRVSQCTT